MTRLRAAVMVLVCTLPAGCGRKAPPLPPEHLVPIAPVNVTARVVDDRVDLQFVVPDKNTTGTAPVSLSRIDIYAKLLMAGEKTPAALALASAKNLIGHVEVKPPVDESAAVTDAPPDPRPGPTEIATFTDATPAPKAPADADSRAKPKKPSKLKQTVQPLVPQPPELPQRVYTLVGVSGKKRPGPPSPVLTVAFGDLPRAPTGPVTTYDHTTLTMTWTPPPVPVADAAAAVTTTGAAAAATIAAAANTTAAASTTAAAQPAAAAVPATPPAAAPPMFRVYTVDHDGHEHAGSLLTPAPISTLTFSMPVAFGKEVCLVVRTVVTSGTVTTESAASEQKCQTPVDTFAPPAPTNLDAVPDEGVVQLAWHAVVASDLAGYIVLRRETGTATLQRLTPVPIRSTTYADPTARAGVEYEYTVRAVDSVTPPNESADSNKRVVRAKAPAPHKDF